MDAPIYKGIIYAILDEEYFYIGSTRRSVLERMGEHMRESKKKNVKSKLYKYINEVRGDWVDILYITLEEIECTDEELRNIEYSYIRNHITDEYCLNTLVNDKQKYIINAIKKKYRKK